MDQILYSQPLNAMVTLMSIWLGNRKSKLRCSGKNLQVRESRSERRLVRKSYTVDQLTSCTVKDLLSITKVWGKNDGYFQVIWRRLVSFMLRSKGNFY